MGAAKAGRVATIDDPEVEGFLALLATQRAPKTVDAYRRDLAALGACRSRESSGRRA